jgi:hypothetical protein
MSLPGFTMIQRANKRLQLRIYEAHDTKGNIATDGFTTILNRRLRVRASSRGPRRARSAQTAAYPWPASKRPAWPTCDRSGRFGAPACCGRRGCVLELASSLCNASARATLVNRARSSRVHSVNLTWQTSFCSTRWHLLRSVELDLDPCSGALTDLISGTAALADQPLQAGILSVSQKLVDVFGETD